MRILTIKHNALKIAFLLFPLLTGLQPFLEGSIQSLFIFFKLILLPIIFLYYSKSKINFLWLLLIVIYFFLVTVFNDIYDTQDLMIYSLSLFGALSSYIFGVYIINNSNNFSIYSYLITGVSLFNIVSLLIYFLILFDFLDLAYVYSFVYRDGEISLLRFALGNAIEVPFTMTTILFSALLLVNNSKKKNNYLFSTSLNFIAAFISQSRVVIIIALILLIYEFLKLEWKYKLIIIGIIVVSFTRIVLIFEEIYFSFIDRLAGNDLGSQKDRLSLLNSVIDNLEFINILFGNGLTSSSFLLKSLTGIYRSVESVFLQILYDTGLFGLIIFFGPITKNLYTSIFKRKYGIALLFVYIQLLFFLPIFSGMMFSFLLFGLSKKNNKIKFV